MSLVFANVAEEDILLRKELEEMAAKHKRFKVGVVWLWQCVFVWHGLPQIRAAARSPWPELAVACEASSWAPNGIISLISQVHHVLNNPPAGWTGSQGFVTKDILK